MEKQSTHELNRQRILKKGKRGFLNILFGRSVIVLLLLAVQVVTLFSLFMHWQGSLYAYGGTYVLSLIMAVYLSNHTMSSASRSTWLILSLLFPLLGTLFYFYVEYDIGHHLVRNRLRQLDQESAQALRQDSALIERVHCEEPELYGLTHLLQNADPFPLYEHCETTYYPLGEQQYAALMEAFEDAEKFIFLEFFIVEDGQMWGDMLDLLVRKAREGVEVRLMYDGTNSIFKVPYRYPEELRALGIQCRMFSPIRPVLSTYYNNRDHRKIVVVDGHTAFTGGINLADEYVNLRAPFGHWKDTGLRIRGQAVQSFTLMFLKMWSITERELKLEPYLSVQPPRFEGNLGYVLPFGDNPFQGSRLGECVYLDVINHAQRYVHIMTPYLIIDEVMTSALIIAARRGVEVEIMLPHVPDKKVAFAAAYTHYRQLLEGGVRIFEYAPGFVHAKEFISDDRCAVIGSINLDYRSLALHFECGCYLFKAPVIRQMERDYRQTRGKCIEITLENIKQVPAYRKIIGPVIKLLAPLM